MNYGKSVRFAARTRGCGWRLGGTARLGLALLVLLWAVPAGAAETILTLGVLRDGKLDAKASRTVHERLTRAGETAPPTTHLALSDRQCAVPECLDTLAAREKAQLVVAARVQQSSGFAYIAAFIYDVAHQRQMDVSAVCDKCLPEALALRVGDLYERLLHDYRERQRSEAAAPRRPTKTAAAPSPAQTNSPTANTQAPTRADAAQTSQVSPTAATNSEGEPAERVTPVQAVPQANEPDVDFSKGVKRPAEHRFALSQRRKIIAGVLGGIGVATLVTAIALHATDGSATSRDCDMGDALAKVCVLDNKVGYSLGYAATAALAAGVGVTLFWPESAKSNQTEVK